jgi:hypothetical protein
MNIENLNQEQLETLRTLLNEMAKTPKQKNYFHEINQMIGNIINEFDFDKVYLTMDYLGWKWDSKHITIDMLKDRASMLLKGATESRLGEYKDEHWELGIINGTGGFVATAWCDEDKTKIIKLNLEFVLTEGYCELNDFDNK